MWYWNDKLAQGYKTVFSCSAQLSIKFIPLINIKCQQLAFQHLAAWKKAVFLGIFKVVRSWNFMHHWVDKKFIFWGPEQLWSDLSVTSSLIGVYIGSSWRYFYTGVRVIVLNISISVIISLKIDVILVWSNLVFHALFFCRTRGTCQMLMHWKKCLIAIIAKIQQNNWLPLHIIWHYIPAPFDTEGESIPFINPLALRTAKTPWSFGHSECNRVYICL